MRGRLTVLSYGIGYHAATSLGARPSARSAVQDLLRRGAHGPELLEDFPMGASTPVPTRLHRAEAFLADKTVTREVLEEAGRLAAEEVAPLSDFRGSEEYRREIVRVVVRRTAAAVFGAKAPE